MRHENERWQEVTKDEFFRVIGPKDVHPCPIGNFPYTSLWKTPRGDVIAKSADHFHEGTRIVSTTYMLPMKDY